MRRNRALLTFAAFSALGVGLYFWSKNPAPQEAAYTAALEAKNPPLAKPVAEPPPAPNGPTPKDAFVSFLASEAETLDQTGLDEQTIEAKLLAVASQMTEHQIVTSKNLALKTTTPANQRVLATYLLGLAGKPAWPALEEILKTPLTVREAKPHSIEETKLMQEKAYKDMSFEALLKQAQSDAEARVFLQRLVEELGDKRLASELRKRLPQ